jgi:hypothetical protein
MLLEVLEKPPLLGYDEEGVVEENDEEADAGFSINPVKLCFQ